MKILFFVVLSFSISSHGAIQAQSQQEKIILELRKPHELAVKNLEVLGTSTYSDLKKIAFAERFPMKTRWRSFMALTSLKGKKSLPEIKKALTHSVWFMRSAGLTAMEVQFPNGAKKWAFKLLDKDPALMVRMKALETLRNVNDDKVTELFWKKVYSSDSLHRNRSLWIRNDLAKILANRPRKKDLKRWVRLLHDKDIDLNQVASTVMAKLHKDVSIKGEQVSFWQKRFPTHKSI